MAKAKGLKFARKWLYEQYIVLGKTTTEIAKGLKTSPPTISYHMKKLNICMRSASERKTGVRNPGFGKHDKRKPHSEKTKQLLSSKLPRGINHFRYKPPDKRIEPINSQIRNCSHSKKWKLTVLERDKFRCVLCNSEKKLEVDRVVPFAVLKKKYSINSLESALLCEELWYPSNGRTLCHNCHIRTDTYGGRIQEKNL